MTTSKKFIALICISLVSLIAVGCSDDSSPVSTSTPVDTAPPAVPADLELNLADGAAVLQWAPNTTDSDLAGYIVERENMGNVTALVSAPAMINSYSDANPVIGISHYSVYAVDESGNQSAVASAELVIQAAHDDHRDIEMSY